MMARWTNSRNLSILPRVVNVSGKKTLFRAVFYLGGPDLEINCVPTGLDKGGLPQYLPATAEQHYEEMYDAAYSPAVVSI